MYLLYLLLVWITSIQLINLVNVSLYKKYNIFVCGIRPNKQTTSEIHLKVTSHYIVTSIFSAIVTSGMTVGILQSLYKRNPSEQTALAVGSILVCLLGIATFTWFLALVSSKRYISTRPSSRNKWQLP